MPTAGILGPMPALFVGHGSPMNAIEQNRYSAGWRDLGERIGRPRAILAISAHWYIRGTAVTGDQWPRTIHDFGGFPPALYAVSYPAPGDPALASRVAELGRPTSIGQSTAWGLDHGTWSVLAHMYPAADIPVVQLSIDATQPAGFHYDLGGRLGALREEGVLLFGSGNIVHNLGLVDWRQDAAPRPWAVAFDTAVADAIEAGRHDQLLDALPESEPGRQAIPTPEHYLPLLYVLGARRANERAELSLRHVELGTISMTSVALGLAAAG